MAFSPPSSKTRSPNTPVASAKKSRQENHSRASGRSGRVSFPFSARSEKGRSKISDDLSAEPNPFRMPPDRNIFVIRNKERQRDKQEKLRQRVLKVHEKTTFATTVKMKSSKKAVVPPESDEEKEEEVTDKAIPVKDDPQDTIMVTRGRHVERESLAGYIAKRREMFLLQYTIGVKRDEIRKYEEIIHAEERKLDLAEQHLEEDAALFDEFLKENDSNSAEALRIAEAETKARFDRVFEIKKANACMVANKSEIAKNEEALRDYRLYRQFLEDLTPPEIQESINAKRQQKQLERRAERAKKKALEKTSSEVDTMDKTDGKGKKKEGIVLTVLAKQILARKRVAEEESRIALADFEDDSDEDLELYFTDPQQLLDIFGKLEEQNLFLIQNSQKTEEALDELKQKIESTNREMGKKTLVLKEQIGKLRAKIRIEEERGNELKTKVKMFSYYRGYEKEDQEKMLFLFNKRVGKVYRKCIGNNEANNSTLQMLASIENRLETLFEQLEAMPKEKVDTAEKAKEKENRLKLREQKLHQQRLHQEERVRKAMERARSVPKKHTGRKVVFRSKPPPHRKKAEDKTDLALQEEEDLKYFFTW